MRLFNIRLRELVSSENLNVKITGSLPKRGQGSFTFGSPPPEWGLSAKRKSHEKKKKIFFSFASIRASRALHSKLRSFKCKQLSAEQYFPVVLFIMQHKVVLTSESLSEILWCDHSNESY